MEEKHRWNAGRFVQLAVLSVYALISLAPLAYMLVTSVKTERDILLRAGTWIPQPWIGNNYSKILHDSQDPIGRWFLNSAVSVSAGTLLTLVVASLAAYALARLDFPGRQLIFYMILGSMLVPGVVYTIPVFSEFANANLIDTYWPLVLVYAAGPFGVFLLRQFYLGIPREIEEAAIVDGAGKFRRWYKIILPMTRTPLLTLSILTFVGIYNDFFWPLVATNSTQMRTITVGIAIVTQGTYTNNYGPLMAFATVAAIPTVLLFLVLQRYFVASAALSGVKG